MTNYPRPCDDCQFLQEDGNCRRYKNCPEWMLQFSQRWKQFNLYAKKHGIEPTTPPQAVETEETE